MREAVVWPALLPQTPVGVGRAAELVPGRDAAVTLAPLLAVAVGFARFKLGREGAAPTEFAVEREVALWSAPLPVPVGVGRAAELAVGREAALGLPSRLATVAGLPRLRLGREEALAVEFAAAREAELWPPPLLPAVIRFEGPGLGRAVWLPPLESPRETGCWRLLTPVGFWFPEYPLPLA